MSVTIGAIGMLLGIIVLIVLSIRGFNAFLAAILASVVVIITNGLPFFDSIITTWGSGMSGFIGTYLLMFCLASAYGEIMKVTGAAESIANFLFGIFGAKWTPIATLIVTWILAYGGINAFIVVFAVYPIAMPMFKKANISKNLMPAIFLYGSVVVLVCTPGVTAGLMFALSEGLGVSVLSASKMGIIALIAALIFGVVYLMLRSKQLSKKGEGFEPSSADLELEKAHEGKEIPPLWSSILPLIAVIVLRFVFLKIGIGTMAASYASIFIATVLLMILQYNNLKGHALKDFTTGFMSSIQPLLLSAGIMGFAAVINACESFQIFVNFSKYLCDVLNPYLSAIVSINIFSGITGASMSGAQIFANTMADTYLTYGINTEALFKITSIASMGLDTLPHCPTFIAMAAVCGVTTKKSYGHVFWCTIIAPIALALLCVVLAMAGIV